MKVCPKYHKEYPCETYYCINCRAKLISIEVLFAENAKIKRHLLVMQSVILKSKNIIANNTHTIFYDSSQKIELEWIDQNAISHEYANGKGKIILKDSETEIGKCAFSYCNELTSIKIPDSVTEIGHSAFCSCKSLKEIIIPIGTREKFEKMLDKELWDKIVER